MSRVRPIKLPPVCAFSWLTWTLAAEWKEDDEDAEDKQQWEDDWDDDEVDDEFSKQLRAELEKTGAQPQGMST